MSDEISAAPLTNEVTVQVGKVLTLTVAVDRQGRVVAIRDIAPPPAATDSHELRLQRHAVASVARLLANVDRGPHDTPALMAQAWGFAALQAANVLRRVEERAGRAMAAAAMAAAEPAGREG